MPILQDSYLAAIAATTDPQHKTILLTLYTESLVASGAQPPKAEPPKAEPPKAEPPKAEPPKAEPPKAEPPKAEPPKAEPPKAEPPKAEPPKAGSSLPTRTFVNRFNLPMPEYEMEHYYKITKQYSKFMVDRQMTNFNLIAPAKAHYYRGVYTEANALEDHETWSELTILTTRLVNRLKAEIKYKKVSYTATLYFVYVLCKARYRAFLTEADAGLMAAAYHELSRENKEKTWNFWITFWNKAFADWNNSRVEN